MTRFFILILGIACLGSAAWATYTKVQPLEAISNDTFDYEFLPSFNFNTGGFGALLSSGKTGTGHDTKSYLQFDLTGVSRASGEVATLNLWAGDAAAAGFGANPTPAFPVQADIYYLTGAWDEATATWGAPPPTGSILIASQSIDGIGKWIHWDITPLVDVWLANPSLNFGLAVVQPNIVLNGLGQKVVAVYDSATGGNRPYLQIPEPVSLGCIGAAALLMVRRRPKC